MIEISINSEINKGYAARFATFCVHFVQGHISVCDMNQRAFRARQMLEIIISGKLTRLLLEEYCS
ncbi:hypothetical protein BS640_07135 [Rouxiella badensis]|uniref:Uncharacterized protein n=1 Tax=Rouxiella badensis TaxID=1646377 RepID=A0A1X0WH64_9GAMM|nr:hypothetical protein BS640_07135 [Rouxiella badensis]